MQISRADLAALAWCTTRLPFLRAGTPGEACGYYGHSETIGVHAWIMSAAQAGVMEPFANHEFQPRAIVRRADLAEVVNRLLGKLAESMSAPIPRMGGRRLVELFTDLRSRPRRLSAQHRLLWRQA